MGNTHCKTCEHWRDKAWDKDKGIGICENPIVIKQVKMISEKHMSQFVAGNNEKEKKYNARFIKNSLRFHSDFGCINHSDLTGEDRIVWFSAKVTQDAYGNKIDGEEKTGRINLKRRPQVGEVINRFFHAGYDDEHEVIMSEYDKETGWITIVFKEFEP